ncbi:Aste57867_25375 [Aphanomyces stellatus]|uniref:Aste57867_25375 protein n=1 Tax=Aphanomyces stellatus TaxID=120398 RepID=A0A485LT37_9STRA|nr:hypothetical protein As57867_025296 [Aphanomyces stellatus]VFU02000.1 Aste57867_25375 [Aphanomyces stellatus]
MKMLTKATAMTRVLVSPDLVDLISAYQDGVYLDMLPFLSVNIRSREPSCFLFWDEDGDDFNQSMAEDIHPLISAWLADYGMLHLPILFARLPFLRDLVLQYAAWAGEASLLRWCHTAYLSLDSLELLMLATIAVERGHLHVLELLRACGYQEPVNVHDAIQSGSLPLVQFLLQDSVDAVVPQLLHAAIATGSMNLVTYLLDRGDALSANGLVSEAAKHGHYDITLALLARGLDASALTIDMAAQGGSLKLVQHLHDVGGYDCTTLAMDWACQEGHLDIVRWLHANRREGCTPNALRFAANRGHHEIVTFVHTTLSSEFWKPFNLMYAARHGWWLVVQYLLDQNVCAWTPDIFHQVVEQGDVPMVQWLHANQTRLGIDITWTANVVARAASNGHLEILQWLHQHNPALECEPWAGCSAIKNGHVEVVQWLMAHGYTGVVHSAGIAKAIQGGELLRRPQEYMVAPNFDLKEALLGAASNGHVRMLRWVLQSNMHVCACEIFHQHVEQWRRDDLVKYVLCKKARQCEKHTNK